MKNRGSGVGRSHGHFESLSGGGEDCMSERSEVVEARYYSQCTGASRVRIAGMMRLLFFVLYTHARSRGLGKGNCC
jgi:hypothetical protein